MKDENSRSNEQEKNLTKKNSSLFSPCFSLSCVWLSDTKSSVLIHIVIAPKKQHRDFLGAILVVTTKKNAVSFFPFCSSSALPKQNKSHSPLPGWLLCMRALVFCDTPAPQRHKQACPNKHTAKSRKKRRESKKIHVDVSAAFHSQDTTKTLPRLLKHTQHIATDTTSPSLSL